MTDITPEPHVKCDCCGTAVPKQRVDYSAGAEWKKPFGWGWLDCRQYGNLDERIQYDDLCPHCLNIFSGALVEAKAKLTLIHGEPK